MVTITLSNEQLREKYTRNMPTAFCSGCGHGTVLNAFTRALETIKLPAESIAVFSGIGCSGWVGPHIRADSMHTTHGRAIAFATGLKTYKPEMNVFVFTGDGDGLGIGGNHLIHAARRNIDLNIILLNNGIYGMTGGQTAPTTPTGVITSTALRGNPANPFDAMELVLGAGATYCARWTTHNARQISKSIIEAVQNPGFSFIEVLSQCPTHFGRRSHLRTTESMMDHYKADFSQRPKEGQTKIGVFRNDRRPEFCEQLRAYKTTN